MAANRLLNLLGYTEDREGAGGVRHGHVGVTGDLDHGAHNVRRDEEFTRHGERTVEGRGVLGSVADSTNQSALVKVGSEVENRALAVGKVRDEDDLVRHDVERRGDELEDHTVVKDHDVLDAARAGLVGVKVLVDVLHPEEIAEEFNGGDHAERHGGTLGELLVEVGLRKQGSRETVQVLLDELLDIARGVSRPDAVHAAHVERVLVHELIDEVASSVLRREGIADFLVIVHGDVLIVNSVERGLDDLEVVEVTADVLELREVGSGVGHTVLTDGCVDNEVTAGGQFVAHGAANDFGADARLALVVLVVAGVQGEADRRNRELGEEGSTSCVIKRTTLDGEVADPSARLEEGGLTIDVGVDVQIDGEACAAGKIGDDSRRRGLASLGVSRIRRDNADGVAVEPKTTDRRLGVLRDLSEVTTRCRDRDQTVERGAFRRRDRAVLNLDKDAVEDDVVFDEVSVVVLLVTGLGRIESHLEHVDLLGELVDTVRFEERSVLVALAHQRHDALSSDGDERRIAVELDHTGRLTLVLRHIEDLEVLTDDGDIALSDRLDRDDTGSEVHVELEEGDREDRLQIRLDTVHVDAESLERLRATEATDEGRRVERLNRGNRAVRRLVHLVGTEGGAFVLAEGLVQQSGDALSSRSEVLVANVSLLAEVDDLLGTEDATDGTSVVAFGRVAHFNAVNILLVEEVEVVSPSLDGLTDGTSGLNVLR